VKSQKIIDEYETPIEAEESLENESPPLIQKRKSLEDESSPLPFKSRKSTDDEDEEDIPNP
jgi:hypothetical protein